MPFDYSHDQYLRKWTLSLGASSAASAGLGGTLGGTGPAATGQELVLTTEQTGYDFRMTFKVRQADVHTPNTAIITIYNLKTETAQQVVNEFDTVTLQAGYVTGNYGIIFKGTVKQYKRGRESATDTYLTIYAADGDAFATGAWLKETIAAGSSLHDQVQIFTQSAQRAEPGLGIKFIAPPGGGPGGADPRLARSRVMYGLTMQHLRTWERSTNQSWSIQNGQIQVVDQKAYLQGEAVVLNARTGMIGVPEATQDGVHVSCLLNPAIQVRGLVKIDNANVNQFGQPEYATVAQYNSPFGGAVQGAQFPEYTSMNFFASVANDGMYVALVIDYEGDTRGLPWYNHMICWAVDASAQPGQVRIGTPGGG